MTDNLTTVEQILERKSHPVVRDVFVAKMHDMHDLLFELEAKGEIIVQCLEGKIGFTACGKTNELEAGHLLYLPAGEPHSLQGIEDGSLLVTILLSNP